MNWLRTSKHREYLLFCRFPSLLSISNLLHLIPIQFNLSRYETLSTEVDYYFPNIQTVKQIQEKFNAFPRKQSVYFDASDYQSIEEIAAEASENLSDTEDQVKPFRLRSGTDISDSLSTSRLKFKNLKSKKNEQIDLQKGHNLQSQKRKVVNFIFWYFTFKT